MADGPGTTPTAQNKSKEDVVAFVLERFKHSEIAHSGFHSKTRRWHDLWRGVIARGAQAYRNQVHIPFILSAVQTFVARTVQSLLSSWPIVGFAGYGQTDAANARRNEVLITAQLKDSDTFQKAYTFFLHAALYGTAICRVGWKTKKQKVKKRILIPGTNQEIVVDDEQTIFDGPDWEPVHICDFFPQPGIQRINDMGWMIHRYYKDLDEMKRMSVGDNPYFMPEGIAELERNSSDNTTDQTGRYFEPLTTWEMLKGEPKGKPNEIKEMWGWVPDEYAIDGVNLVVIAVANNKALVKYDTFPFWHGELGKVFIKYSPKPAPTDFFGVGIAEINEKLQIVANKLASQKLDGIEATMDPMWWVNEALGITGPVLTRAGKMITVNGPVDESMIRQFSPDVSALQQAYPEIQTLYGYIQMGSGITEEVSGLASSGGNRQTAREFLGKQENALTTLSLSTQLAEQGWLEPLCDTYRALNRQHLKLPYMTKILGPQAFTNPFTGEVLPPEPQIVDLDDINPDYRARAYGASQMMGKSAKQQNYMGFLQSVGAILGVAGPLAPALITKINLMALLREGATLFDFRNLDEIFTPMQMATEPGPMDMNGAMGGSGMTPPASPPGPLQLDQLSPDVLNNQLAGTLGEPAPIST